MSQPSTTNVHNNLNSQAQSQDEYTSPTSNISQSQTSQHNPAFSPASSDGVPHAQASGNHHLVDHRMQGFFLEKQREASAQIARKEDREGNIESPHQPGNDTSGLYQVSALPHEQAIAPRDAEATGVGIVRQDREISGSGKSSEGADQGRSSTMGSSAQESQDYQNHQATNSLAIEGQDDDDNALSNLLAGAHASSQSDGIKGEPYSMTERDYALRDFQIQLMILEQQKKQRKISGESQDEQVEKKRQSEEAERAEILQAVKAVLNDDSDEMEAVDDEVDGVVDKGVGKEEDKTRSLEVVLESLQQLSKHKPHESLAARVEVTTWIADACRQGEFGPNYLMYSIPSQEVVKPPQVSRLSNRGACYRCAVETLLIL